MTKWGQHFLKNESVLSKVVHSSDITKRDLVVEIGTGRGHLTQILAQHAGVVLSFEIDPDLYFFSTQVLAGEENVVLFQEDFLRANLPNLIGHFPFSSLKVIANLPYYISSLILSKILVTPLPWGMILILVQKEFGQKIMAPAGDRSRNALTVAVELRMMAQKVCDVSRFSFQPPPHVDSMVLKLLPVPESPDQKVFQGVMSLVHSFFQQRRKKVSTLCRNIFPPGTEIEAFLNQYHISGEKRPEDLLIQEWMRLYQAFAHFPGVNSC